jgi:hypothetical protein
VHVDLCCIVLFKSELHCCIPIILKWHTTWPMLIAILKTFFLDHPLIAEKNLYYMSDKIMLPNTWLQGFMILVWIFFELLNVSRLLPNQYIHQYILYWWKEKKCNVLLTNFAKNWTFGRPERVVGTVGNHQTGSVPLKTTIKRLVSYSIL